MTCSPPKAGWIREIHASLLRCPLFFVKPMSSSLERVSQKDISHPGRSEFCLTGQFLAFVFDDGKVRYLRLGIADQELQIKLSKQARAALLRSKGNEAAILQPWQTVRILGVRKLNRQGELKWKAHEIQRVTAPGEFPLPNDWRELTPDCSTEVCQTTKASRKDPASQSKKSKKANFKILTCHKSGCAKRGGDRQCQAITKLLQERGLSQQVSVETTGCLGKCSMAPNLLLMPGKKRLSGMKPAAIVDLIERLYHSSASFNGSLGSSFTEDRV